MVWFDENGEEEDEQKLGSITLLLEVVNEGKKARQAYMRGKNWPTNGLCFAKSGADWIGVGRRFFSRLKPLAAHRNRAPTV